MLNLIYSIELPWTDSDVSILKQSTASKKKLPGAMSISIPF